MITSKLLDRVRAELDAYLEERFVGVFINQLLNPIPHVLPDLNVNTLMSGVQEGGNLACVRHNCGCYAYWDRNKDGTDDWITAIDSFWKVCDEHYLTLANVRRPTFHEGGGYPWARYGWKLGIAEVVPTTLMRWSVKFHCRCEGELYVQTRFEDYCDYAPALYCRLHGRLDDWGQR